MLIVFTALSSLGIVRGNSLHSYITSYMVKVIDAVRRNSGHSYINGYRLGK